jgi:aminomethyltransferase
MSTVAEGGAILQRTPLYDLHCESGARMCSFAGYEMPAQYALGVLKEHLHTRSAAGVFDISHMGQIRLWPRVGDLGVLAHALERLVPVDLAGLVPGRQRYAFFTNAEGGITDDLMIGHCGDHLLLVVNASRKSIDEGHLRTHLADVCEVELLADRALVAVQGPAAERVLSCFAGPLAAMRFMQITELVLGGCSCVVARSGYTGEDGFEISIPARAAEELVRAVLQHPEAAFAGLGARDSLRTEAALCLYGADLDETTTPVEAGLEWAIQKARRRGGKRAGDFPGADVVLRELDVGPRRRRVGLLAQARVPVRRGALLFTAASAGEPVGKVTSGLYGPSVGAPVAMGYVASEHAVLQTRLFAEVRGNRTPVVISALPFVPHRYKRAQ